MCVCLCVNVCVCLCVSLCVYYLVQLLEAAAALDVVTRGGAREHDEGPGVDAGVGQTGEAVDDA